jgi:iron(III) transport system ATP-binding protein
MGVITDTGNGVEITNLSKSFAGVRAIDDVTLTIAPGEFVALLGPSSGGKTTLLRAIAGLVTPDRGTVRIGPDTVVDTAKRQFVPPEQRRLGMVFQDYALWPHMRVSENVGFPLEARGVAKSQRQDLIATALRRVGLDALAKRFPGELSGGQQQRVALARAIVDSPRLILFDEPLSNLDANLRDALGREIAQLVRELGATAVYVTHDQGEALSLSDRIAVLREGRLVALGTPEQLYRQPPDAWVAQFLKVGSLISGQSTNGMFTPTGLDQQLALPELVNGHAGPSTLLLPGSALLIGAPNPDVDLAITSVQFRGDRYEVSARLSPNDHGPLVHFWHDRPLKPGDRVPAALDRKRLRLYMDDKIDGSGA